eukprot:m.26509 g.26509  ORF g.26509 m.26509 type:complete len:210 (-) comp7804_c0_seq3:606-1235(-)
MAKCIEVTVFFNCSLQYAQLFQQNRYRARLDSVVVVVDTDDLAHELQGNTTSHMLDSNQLQCADVILLNKCDLVSQPEIDTTRSRLQEIYPGIQVHQCSFGDIPLHKIIEVSEQTLDRSGSKGVIAHETARGGYDIGSGDLRALRAPRPDNLKSIRHDQSHVKTQRLDSTSFESDTPFYLHKWQDFLRSNLLNGVHRMKAILNIFFKPT